MRFPPTAAAFYIALFIGSLVYGFRPKADPIPNVSVYPIPLCEPDAEDCTGCVCTPSGCTCPPKKPAPSPK